jgi:tetratricopeptide (TPR) repeat protein
VLARFEARYEESAVHLAEARILADIAGDQQLMASCLLAAGWDARDRNQLASADQYFERAYTLATELGESVVALRALTGTAETAHYLGQWERSQAFWLQARDLSERLGHRGSLAYAYSGLADLRCGQGRFSEAIDWARRAVSVREHLGVPEKLASALNTLGEQLRAAGQLDEAETCYRRAHELYRLLSSTWVFLPQANLGFLLLARGDWAQAGRVLRESAREMEARGRITYLQITRFALLPVLAWEGDWTEFDATMDRAEAELKVVFDVDIARAAGMAGPLASAAAQPVRAGRAWAVMAAQYAGLGNPEEEARARAELAALAL